MLAACCATCCVREGAPERGDARRRCLPFVASFGLSKFGCSSAQTTAGRCRALAQRFMRVEALRWTRTLHGLGSARRAPIWLKNCV